MDSGTVIKNYKKIALSTPNFSKSEELDLIKEYKKNGGLDAKEKIINAYLKIIIKMAERFSNKNHLDELDLIQSGIVGVVTALDTFDLSQYTKLTKNTGSLFSFWCHRNILCEIDNYYRNNIRQVNIPFTTNNRLYKINKLYKNGELNQFESLYDDKTVNYICKTLDLQEKEVKFLLTLFKPEVHLDGTGDSSQDQDDNNFSQIDHLEKEPSLDNSYLSPDISCKNNEKFSILSEKINNLSKEEQYIISRRFGINCKKQTLSQISQKIGCSSGNIVIRTKKIQEKLKKMIVEENLLS